MSSVFILSSGAHEAVLSFPTKPFSDIINQSRFSLSGLDNESQKTVTHVTKANNCSYKGQTAESDFYYNKTIVLFKGL